MTARAIGDLLSGTSPKSYAPSPVWKDSAAGEVKFISLPKRQAVRLFHDARRFERQTRKPGRQDGIIGRNGLAILHAMLFDCLNYASGRLDPSYAGVARLANISVRSVARGLVKLRDAGVLNWVRRCRVIGRQLLEQDTNAYAVLPSRSWRGFFQAPPPDPATTGAHPPMADLGTLAVEAMRTGLQRHGQALLESPAGNALHGAIARLGRRRQDPQ